MSRIVWDRPEERKFEVGVEKGVLYVGNTPGVPWNGLISVDNTYAGGEVESRYQDGVKTHNYIPLQEFESEITAYTYPDEFEECLGLQEVYRGFFSDEQDRTPFGMSYQTRIGDSVSGDNRGRKIHLIYNAIATPTQLTQSTIGDSPEPTEFGWGLRTSPVEAPGYRPSSHFVLDSTRMGPVLLSHLTDLLYGAPGTPPRLLYPKDILEITEDWSILYPSPNTYPSIETIPGGP